MSCERRWKSKKESLSARLTRVYALMFAAMTLCLSLCVFFMSYRFLIERQRSSMMANAEIISDLILTEVAQGDLLSSDEMLSELNTNENLSLLVIDTSGGIVNQSSNFSVATQDIPECVGKTVLYTQGDGMMLMCHAEALEDQDRNIGLLTLIVNMDEERAFLEMLAWLLISVNLVGLIAALAVGWVTTRKLLVPIGSMIEKARSIGGGLMNARLDVPEADDELRKLALTLNGMLDRVECAFIRQGQFTQDASHELRTPLSVLQGNAELLSRWGKDDPKVRDKCIQTIERQAEYMRRLVEALLFLARGDGGKQVLRVESIDVNDLFSEILDERRGIDPGHLYAMSVEKTMTARADLTLLRQLLSILLDNAAKYTPSGKRISVFAHPTDSGMQIGVADEGVGVAPDQLEHIFERFYRLDKARARATGGMGLGLSIAQTIVSLHGGSIYASCAPGQGLTVTAELPNP